MGLLDELLGDAGSKILGQMLGTQGAKPGATSAAQPGAAGAVQPGAVNPAQVVESVLAMLKNPQTGGLAGMVKTFAQAGLAEQVGSWVGKGANLPVSADQIRQALGNEQLQSMAKKLGLNTESVAGVLSQVLPKVVDHLTPTGQVPAAPQLEQGLNALGQMLKK
jgi:uncharacterized protein YidB (DUF937 family)